MSNTIQSKGLATTPLSTDDILAIVQGGVLKRATIGDIPVADVITNANGVAVRWENGFQAMTSTLLHNADLSAGDSASGIWTYPASRVSGTPWCSHRGTASAAQAIAAAENLRSATTPIDNVSAYWAIANIGSGSFTAARLQAYHLGFWK